MELWDIYDSERKSIGRTHERGKPMKGGDFHLEVNLWIINKEGRVLIQKRQPWKSSFPNMWDCSVDGSVVSGESTADTLVRETNEEIGLELDIESVSKVLTVKFENIFADVWILFEELDLQELVLQEEEVSEVRWASFDEIRKLIVKREFIPYNYIEKLESIINKRRDF